MTQPLFYSVEQIQKTHSHLNKTFFPHVEGVSNKVMMEHITQVWRWFLLYRNLIKDPLPMPKGTMCELVLMLELVLPAYLDYCTDNNTIQERMGYFFKLQDPLLHPTLALLMNTTNMRATENFINYTLKETIMLPIISSLQNEETCGVTKARIMGLTMPMPHLMPTALQPYLNSVLQWFSLYRFVTKNPFPPPKGTSCEIFLMTDLMDAAMLHHDLCEMTRLSMSLVIFGPLRPTMRTLRYEAWAADCKFKRLQAVKHLSS